MEGVVMIGGVVPWLKSLTGTPALSAEYVECNGQALSDAQSALNGQTIPNLNGASSQPKRFLRGSSVSPTASGASGGADTHTHGRGARNMCAGTTLCCSSFCPIYLWDSKDNLPLYYEVVYVMRVK